MTVRMVVYDPDPPHDWYLDHPGTAVSATWQRVTHTQVATGTHAAAEFAVVFEGGMGTVWIDDVSLTSP